MTPTPLHPTNMYAVAVPKGDASISWYIRWRGYCEEKKLPILNSELPELPPGEWKFLGLVTKDTIDFDAHLYVSTHFNGLFTNYEQEDENASDAFVETPEDSFRSLLSANECWFENPFPHPVDVDPAQRAHYDEIVADWQAAQSKVHECWAIIEKV